MLIATLFADIHHQPWFWPVAIIVIIVAICIEWRKAGAPKITVRSQRHTWYR